MDLFFLLYPFSNGYPPTYEDTSCRKQMNDRNVKEVRCYSLSQIWTFVRTFSLEVIKFIWCSIFYYYDQRNSIYILSYLNDMGERMTTSHYPSQTTTHLLHNSHRFVRHFSFDSRYLCVKRREESRRDLTETRTRGSFTRDGNLIPQNQLKGDPEPFLQKTKNTRN